MKRTVVAIALRPTGNFQVGYYFYSILSGRCLNPLSWTELPIPDEAFQRMEKMYHRRDHGYTF